MKIDRNMSEFWCIVCKNIILSLVYFLVLFYGLLSLRFYRKVISNFKKCTHNNKSNLKCTPDEGTAVLWRIVE